MFTLNNIFDQILKMAAYIYEISAETQGQRE